MLAAGVYWFVRRITESPYGRTLRAMRDNDKVADSLGKNLLSLRTGDAGHSAARSPGLSGGVLVSFISVWSPAAWTYAETIVLFAAVIIGGRGNHLGAVLGAVLVPVGFEEVTRLITNANPSLPPNLLPSLQWVAIGLLIAVFLWFRPQGVAARAQAGDRAARPADRRHAAAAAGRGRAVPAPRADPGPTGARGGRHLAGRGRQPAISAACTAVRGVSLSVRRGTADRPDRAERRRQVHPAGPAGRDRPGVRRARSSTRARTSPACPRSAAPGSAWSGPSSWPASTSG